MHAAEVVGVVCVSCARGFTRECVRVRLCECIGTDDHMVSMDILYVLREAAPTLAQVQNSVEVPLALTA